MPQGPFLSGGGGAGGGGTIGGSGTSGVIPRFTAATTIGDSKLSISTGVATLYDDTAVTGVSTFNVRAGAGQSTTTLQNWRNSSNTILASISAGGLFLAPAGAAAGPGLSFVGDPDTGWFSSGTNTMDVATGGTARGRWSSAGMDVGANAILFGAAIGTPQSGLAQHASGIIKITDGSTGSGSIRVAAGSSSAPSYSFVSDTTSGMYDAAVGTVVVQGITAGAGWKMFLGNGGYQGIIFSDQSETYGFRLASDGTGNNWNLRSIENGGTVTIQAGRDRYGAEFVLNALNATIGGFTLTGTGNAPATNLPAGTVTISGANSNAARTGGNLNGGDVVIQAGAAGVAGSTGGLIEFKTAATGTGTTLTSRWKILDSGVLQPSTDKTYSIGDSTHAINNLFVATSVQGWQSKTLTESAATGFVDIALAQNTVIGGKVEYVVHTTNGTDRSVESGEIFFTGASKTNGTIDDADVGAVGTPIQSTTTANSWTNTFTVTKGTNKLTLECNSVSSLTGTDTIVIYYRVHLNGPQTATITPL